MVAWGDVPTWFLVVLGAVGSGAALRQLGLQRVQLHDEQEVIRPQTLIQERQQADQIDVVARTIDGVQAGVLGRDEVPKGGRAPVHMVVVVNGSITICLSAWSTEERLTERCATRTSSSRGAQGLVRRGVASN
jgi:hypothetical protein